MSTAFGFSSETSLGTNGFEVSLNYITGIPDPNLLICSNTLKLAFKSLLKRDVNTKEKAISNMLEFIKENPSELNNDLTIITWVQLYPKLSIDDSKKVRSLSHQIQSQFVLTLGKLYVKYLKDTIGIWLSGYYDSDRSTSKVCKESVQIAFGGNAEKISNLWKIFTSQILNYSHQVLANETKDTLSDERFCSNDESEAKYLRVLQASILLIVHVMSEINTMEKLSDNVIELLQSIFNQEALHEAFNSKDFNFKKAAYLSFKTLVTSKHVNSIINKHSYKALSKAMVKGIKFDSKINPLLYSNVIITILDTLVQVSLYDPSFWINIKKSDDKLLSLLKLGSINSEPIYYDIVFKLFKILPDDFISITDSEKFKPYYDAFLSSVEKEKSITFLEKGWKILITLIKTLISDGGITNHILETFTLALIKLIDSPRLLALPLKNLMNDLQSFMNDDKDVLLDINSLVMDSLPNKPLILSDFNDYTVKNVNNFLESFLDLLICNESDLEEILLANSIESLEEESSQERPILAFTIINLFIKKRSEKFEDSISSFVLNLPYYITESYIDQPLQTLVLFSHLNFAKDTNVNALVDKVFSKLRNFNLESDLLKIIPKLAHFNIHEAKEINNYLLSTSKESKGDNKNNASSFYEILTLEILSNLYKSENFSSFIYNSSIHYNNELFIEFSEQMPEFLGKLLSVVINDEEENRQIYSYASDLLKKLESNLLVNEVFTEVFKTSLLKIVENCDSSFTSIVTKLSAVPKDIYNSYVQIDLLNSFEIAFSESPQKLLSLANSLDLGLFFFIENYEKESKIDFNLAKQIINRASFYSEMLKSEINLNSMVEKNIINLSLISEFSSDVLFLETSFSGIMQEKTIEFQATIKSMLLKSFKNISYEELFKAAVENKTDNNSLSYLLTLLSNENKTISYYSYRILKYIFSEKVESLSHTTFEELNFKPLSKYPILLFIILSSSKKHLTSNNLDFVRTNCVANLISIKRASEISSIGLKELLLLNAFIDIDLDYHIPEDLVLIAPQRCLILLNTISSWLESEIAYDESFKPVRITMMQFIERYIGGIYYVCDSKYPSDFIGKVFGLGTKLLSETINLVDSEDDIAIDLLHSSLRQYILLYKYKADIESWDDDCADTEEEIINLFFKISKLNNINQPVNILCEQFSRILIEIVKPTKLSSYYEKMYDLMDIQNIQIQRVCCVLLHKLIPEVQDNLVVEFALSKKKANEEGTSGIHLPKTLINITNTPLLDYIEFEAPWKVYQYLWSWYLIMDHFKNITQQMRQDYINDLSEEKICMFLNFIFTELNINKFKLHDDEKTYVKDYSFNDNSILSYDEETKKLLVNLLYEIMNNIGGTFTQNWFHSIKDKQFQQSIEKFIVSFISPELINDILSTLADKNSIEDSEFKININRKTNEIKCLYNIDEQKMEISITLPANYPLSQISVNGISRVGVDEKKWKSWIMSAQYVINFQNGTILDSIKHFKDNVTANFENYDDCAICYSILNAVDHSTPNKVCPTCKHNFHSACLYRWFKSSGASTCPLCRSKFQFKKHS